MFGIQVKRLKLIYFPSASCSKIYTIYIKSLRWQSGEVEELKGKGKFNKCSLKTKPQTSLSLCKWWMCKTRPLISHRLNINTLKYTGDEIRFSPSLLKHMCRYILEMIGERAEYWKYLKILNFVFHICVYWCLKRHGFAQFFLSK